MGMGVASRPACWPVLDGAALYGLAGEVVCSIAPHTEADRAALLLDFLCSFGSAVGSGPYTLVSGTTHRLRVSSVFVGKTGAGRKGTSHGAIVPIFERADADWLAQRCTSGMASGEGLIAAVRDGSGDEPGVTDKRLFVIEQEFARVLRAASREGSILSSVLRESWDGDRLSNLTKRDPQHATRPHIAFLGHITTEELARCIGEADLWNGFANRCLWAVVHRSQLLPSGGALEDAVYDRLGRAVKETLHQARKIGRMQRSETAEKRWAGMYGALAHREVSGVVAAVTDRAEAQCLRLSMLFAALDGTSTIDERHLEAAWAVLWYCEQSARVIFGNTHEDTVADRILRALHQQPINQGLDRTELHSLFSRNLTASRLDAALEQLAQEGRIEKVSAGEGPGRRRFVYFLTSDESNETNEDICETERRATSFISSASFLSYAPLTVSSNGSVSSGIVLSIPRRSLGR
jgi:hypothetical protein